MLPLLYAKAERKDTPAAIVTVLLDRVFKNIVIIRLDRIIHT